MKNNILVGFEQSESCAYPTICGKENNLVYQFMSESLDDKERFVVMTFTIWGIIFLKTVRYKMHTSLFPIFLPVLPLYDHLICTLDWMLEFQRFILLILLGCKDIESNIQFDWPFSFVCTNQSRLRNYQRQIHAEVCMASLMNFEIIMWRIDIRYSCETKVCTLTSDSLE